MLFQNTEGKQARSLRSMNAFAKVGGGEFFPVDGEFLLRPHERGEDRSNAKQQKC
jgi:hypothetical protein